MGARNEPQVRDGYGEVLHYRCQRGRPGEGGARVPIDRPGPRASPRRLRAGHAKLTALPASEMPMRTRCRRGGIFLRPPRPRAARRRDTVPDGVRARVPSGCRADAEAEWLVRGAEPFPARPVASRLSRVGTEPPGSEPSRGRNRARRSRAEQKAAHGPLSVTQPTHSARVAATGDGRRATRAGGGGQARTARRRPLPSPVASVGQSVVSPSRVAGDSGGGRCRCRCRCQRR